jgi:hypothetical protein
MANNSVVIQTNSDAALVTTTNTDIANLERLVLESNGTVQVYDTSSNIYVTAVQQVLSDQKFINNEVNNPGGSNLQIQFNLAGNFAGSNTLAFNPLTGRLQTYGLDVTTDLALDPNAFHLTGGNTGYILQTDGQGNVSWVPTPQSGGNVTVAGVSKNIQYNNNSALGASANFNWDESNSRMVVGNNSSNVTLTTAGNVNAVALNVGYTTITANTIKAANSSVKIDVTASNIAGNAYTLGYLNSSNTFVQVAKQQWTSATTTGTSTQALLNVAAANVVSIDYHITSNTSTGSQQVSRVMALVQGSNVLYNEYGTIIGSTDSVAYSVTFDNTSNVVTLSATSTDTGTTNYNVIYTVYA